ncbi:MAG: hypothetical protein UT02_C0040G0004 [Parcubacteria group bacterium GW2011_GWC2_38_7]|nr:MAG: hypothetical protein UT02_C0040G0004 [Parcubacteria group bacterium GW2011_GWC2_38_7]
MTQLGIYQHYKGGRYQVIGVAKHSETLEDLVVYIKLDNNTLWVSPQEMFESEVVVEGIRKLRFEYLGEK